MLLSQSQASGNDLNGVALPSSTTSYQYDAYSNATQITVASSDGYSKTTTNTYTNDIGNWLLGRLATATVSSTAPAATSQAPGADTTPDPFDFTDITDSPISTVHETSVFPLGFNRRVNVSVSGGGAQIRKNDTGDWGNSIQVNAGDKLNVRLASSSAYGVAVTAVVSVGGVSADWVISTPRLISVSGNTNNFNLRAAHDALYPVPTGSETPPANVIAIIEPNVIVGSTSTAIPSFDVRACSL